MATNQLVEGSALDQTETGLGAAVQSGMDSLVDVLGDATKDYYAGKDKGGVRQVEDKTMKHLAIALVLGGGALFAWKRWGRK